MADITKIEVHVRTADVHRAGTCGWVYLGIASREFLLNADRASGGFDRGDERRFVLGDDANVENPRFNDPRRPQLDTDDLDRYPTYVRFEPSGHHPSWCVERVWVIVNPHSDYPQSFDNPDLADVGEHRRLWLGQEYGKQLYLKRYTP